MTGTTGPGSLRSADLAGATPMRAAPVWQRWVLGGVVALAGAFLAVTAGVANIAHTLGAAPALPFSRIVGPARIADLTYRVIAARGVVGPALAARARASGGDDPVTDEPFLFAAAAYFPSDRSLGAPAAGPLLNEALRRNPRSRLALSLAMRRAVGSGNLGAAMDQLAVLNRLSQSIGAPMLESVGRSVATGPLVDDAARALGNHPELVPAFVRGFVAGPKDVALIERMAQHLPKAALTDPVVGQALISRLIEGGKYDAAMNVWQALGGQRGSGLVNDPAFTRKAPVKPFDWERFESDSGVAEAADRGGLAVEYYGRQPGPLVRQLVRLAPGSYHAKLDIEGVSGNGGSIALHLVCPAGDRVLASHPLVLKPGRQTLDLPLTIAAGDCTGQFLSLVGLPRDARDDQAVVVRRLDVLAGR